MQSTSIIRRWICGSLLITVLVLIGFITVLRAGVGLVANLFDDTAQKQEYEDKLEGLVLFDPVPFEGIENIDDLIEALDEAFTYVK